MGHTPSNGVEKNDWSILAVRRLTVKPFHKVRPTRHSPTVWLKNALHAPRRFAGLPHPSQAVATFPLQKPGFVIWVPEVEEGRSNATPRKNDDNRFFFSFCGHFM
jgi:hypothetical protein